MSPLRRDPLLALLALLVLALSACACGTGSAPPSPPTPPPPPCTGPDGCQRLGVCSDKVCTCLPGFRGPTCGELDLLPPASLAAGRLWPTSAAGLANTSAWGFSVVNGSGTAGGPFLAVADVSCGTMGVLGRGGADSFQVLLASPSSISSGYKLVAAFTPAVSFNPHMIRAPDESVLVIFRVNDMDLHPLCPGNGTMLNTSGTLQTIVPRSALHAGDPSRGVNMYVAQGRPASSLALGGSAAWVVRPVNVSGLDGLHESNPSIQYVDLKRFNKYCGHATGAGATAAAASAADTVVVMAFRFNGHHGEDVGFGVSTSGPFGPFAMVANLSCSGCEDPHLFQLADGSVHAIFHDGPHGYHAWAQCPGRDAAAAAAPLSSWGLDMNVHAYELEVQFGDGSVTAFKRRERPELVLDATGRPTHLINGVRDDDAVFSFIQAVNS